MRSLQSLSFEERGGFSHHEGIAPDFDINNLPPTAAGMDGEPCVAPEVAADPELMQQLPPEYAKLPVCEAQGEASDVPPESDVDCIPQEQMQLRLPGDDQLPVCEPPQEIDEQRGDDGQSRSLEADDTFVGLVAALSGWKVSRGVGSEKRGSSRIEKRKGRRIMKWDEDSATLVDEDQNPDSAPWHIDYKQFH